MKAVSISEQKSVLHKAIFTIPENVYVCPFLSNYILLQASIPGKVRGTSEN